ncbi:MAG: hypothetical protein AB8C84_02920 [Oligoflexales bacterium]
MLCGYFVFWSILWVYLKPTKDKVSDPIASLFEAKLSFVTQTGAPSHAMSKIFYDIAQKTHRSSAIDVLPRFEYALQEFSDQTLQNQKIKDHKIYFMVRMFFLQFCSFFFVFFLYGSKIQYPVFFLIHGVLTVLSLVVLEVLIPRSIKISPEHLFKSIVLGERFEKIPLMKTLSERERFFGVDTEKEKAEVWKYEKRKEYQLWLMSWKLFEGWYCLFELMTFICASSCWFFGGISFKMSSWIYFENIW